MKSLTLQHKTANAFACILVFLQPQRAKQKKQKRYQANAPNQRKCGKLTDSMTENKAHRQEKKKNGKR